MEIALKSFAAIAGIKPEQLRAHLEMVVTAVQSLDARLGSIEASLARLEDKHGTRSRIISNPRDVVIGNGRDPGGTSGGSPAENSNGNLGHGTTDA